MGRRFEQVDAGKHWLETPWEFLLLPDVLRGSSESHDSWCLKGDNQQVVTEDWRRRGA